MLNAMLPSAHVCGVRESSTHRLEIQKLSKACGSSAWQTVRSGSGSGFLRLWQRVGRDGGGGDAERDRGRFPAAGAQRATASCMLTHSCSKPTVS
jgi:hypothetical protein